MKRISFLLALIVAGVINVMAQMPDGSTGVAPNFASLEKKVQKSDESLQDPKKGIDPKTWIDRAKLFIDIYDANVSLLRSGMGVQELKLIMKEPKEIKKIEVAGSPVEQYVYDRVNVNLENGAVKSWEETKFIKPDPLNESLSSYKKAIELDKEGKQSKKITEGLKELKSRYEKKALNDYSLKEFVKSHESFKAMVEINENKLINTADTAYVYYAGVTAVEAGKPADAIPFFRKALDMNYNSPSVFTDLNKAYLALGDSTKALEVLQEGNKKYPENVAIMIELINYYLVRGQSAEALAYLNKAKSSDPNNTSFYFAEGILYDKMGKMNEALAAYDKAIELDNKYYNAYYNAAVIYYNFGVKLLEEAQEEKNNDKYLEKKNKSEEEFKKAIPYMEKASEISPNDIQTLETLKSLYYRLKINDKLEVVNQKLKELKG